MKYISIYIYLFIGMKMTIHRNLKIYDLDFSLIKITVEMNIFLVKYYLNISPKKSIIYILRSQSLSLSLSLSVPACAQVKVIPREIYMN